MKQLNASNTGFSAFQIFKEPNILPESKVTTSFSHENAQTLEKRKQETNCGTYLNRVI